MSYRLLALILLLPVLACEGPSSSEPTETPPVIDESPEPTQPVEPVPTPPVWGPLADATCSNGRAVHVSYAIDGDTVALSNLNDEGEKEHVRLVGIDTPETYPEDEVECYGPEASDYTHQAVDDRDACLVYDPAVTAQSNNVDMYGRTLGYVFFGDEYSRFLNAELVAGGYATDYPYTKGAAFEEYFAELETYAKDLDLGMWGACTESSSRMFRTE